MLGAGGGMERLGSECLDGIGVESFNLHGGDSIDGKWVSLLKVGLARFTCKKEDARSCSVKQHSIPCSVARDTAMYAIAARHRRPAAGTADEARHPRSLRSRFVHATKRCLFQVRGKRYHVAME